MHTQRGDRQFCAVADGRFRGDLGPALRGAAVRALGKAAWGHLGLQKQWQTSPLLEKHDYFQNLVIACESSCYLIWLSLEEQIVFASCHPGWTDTPGSELGNMNTAMDPDNLRVVLN